jgi:hypothetical protein
MGISSILSNLRQYMYILNSTPLILNAIPVASAVSVTSTTEPVNISQGVPVSVPVPVSTNEYITPKLSDTLFWCIFIAVNGYDEYLQIHRNYGVKELEIKKLVADMAKNSPHLFKLTNYKITKVAIQEILSELLTSQKDTSMQCFIAMLIYYKINAILVNSTKEFMIEFISNKDSELPTYILNKDGKNYSINIEPVSKEQIENMKETMICLENYSKPLKSVSSYKTSDLTQLAKKLGVYDETEKLKKPELYEKITEYMKWK